MRGLCDLRTALTTRTGGSPGGGAARRPVLDQPLARRGCEVSVLVLVGSSRLYGGEPIRLILYFRGDLLEFRLELAPVVGAEEQFTAADQDDAQICLGAATVTAVCCGQRARGGQNSSHVASSLARRAVVPGSTSNQAENVPARGFSSKLLLGVAVCCRLAANVPYAERYGFALLVLGVGPAGRLAGLFMRTCPEPKWFMRRRERDVHVTPTNDRTSMRARMELD